MDYTGFRITCDCHCSVCGNPVVLEGYSDAYGTHYCAHCNDYVLTREGGNRCPARTPEKIAYREKIIVDNNAYD